jgi:hypothetical protein
VKNISGKTLRMDANLGRLGKNVAHGECDCGLGPAGFRIESATFEAEYAKVTELCREVGFGALNSMKTGWGRAHPLNYIERFLLGLLSWIRS